MNKTITYFAFSSVNFVIANKIGYYKTEFNGHVQKRPVGTSLVIAVFTPVTMPYYMTTTSLYCFGNLVDKLDKWGPVS